MFALTETALKLRIGLKRNSFEALKTDFLKQEILIWVKAFWVNGRDEPENVGSEHFDFLFLLFVLSSILSKVPDGFWEFLPSERIPQHINQRIYQLLLMIDVLNKGDERGRRNNLRFEVKR